MMKIYFLSLKTTSNCFCAYDPLTEFNTSFRIQTPRFRKLFLNILHYSHNSNKHGPYSSNTALFSPCCRYPIPIINRTGLWAASGWGASIMHAYIIGSFCDQLSCLKKEVLPKQLTTVLFLTFYLHCLFLWLLTVSTYLHFNDFHIYFSNSFNMSMKI